MGSEIPFLPSVDLFKSFGKLKRGTTEWKLMCQNVCKFMEEYGCLVVEYDEISTEEKEEVFGAMNNLLSLPAEAKLKNGHLGQYRAYNPPSSYVPYIESFAAFNPAIPEKMQEFTNYMWPQGNEKFCQTMSSMCEKMLGFMQILLDVIFDNYGLENYQNLNTENMDTLLRMFKYTAPKKDEPQSCLPGHVDTNFLTILFENGVEGLECKSKDGKWFRVKPGKNSFLIFVGQSLKAWSNGRLHGNMHKVAVSGKTDRLTWVFFLKPKEDQTIEPHTGFIDEEHPLRFKPFNYKDLHHYLSTKGSFEGSLETFLGI